MKKYNDSAAQNDAAQNFDAQNVSDNGKPKLKKSAKIAIIISAVVLVLAIIGLSLGFGWINTGRFMTYTKAHLNKAVAAYAARQAGDNPLRFVAHRGLSSEAYQNTAEAFQKAAEYDGVWAIETDVWVTSDGNFVCMHDRNALQGISDVSKVSLETALSTPLKGAPNGEHAPTLEQYLDIAIGGGKVALIELKDTNMTQQAMLQLLEKVKGNEANVRIISFHYNLLKFLRAQNPQIGLWYLFNLSLSKDIEGGTRKAKLNTLINMQIDIGANGMFLKKSDVEIMHRGGREVNCWTVNSARNALFFSYEYNVDIITSDYRLSDAMSAF